MNIHGNVISARYVIGALIFAIVGPLLPLLISRHWDWWQAWIYAVIFILSFVITRFLASQRHPGILLERGRVMQMEDAKSWDKLLLPLLLLTFYAVLGVAGLDELYNWSAPFNPLVTIVSFLIVILGYAFGSWALIENPYFSSMVRIQDDRGHQLVTSGPYAWIRHPGYAGTLLTYLVSPFCLESWWACIPTLLAVLILVVRTSLEDKVLINELKGYRDYTQCVRYRLVPGIW